MNALQQSLAIGPAGVTLSHLLMLLSLGVALLVGALLGRRQLTTTGDTLLNVVILGVLGARLAFVVLYHDSYYNLWQMIDVRDGGFHVAGGVLTAALYAGWALWRHPPQRKALSGGLAAGVGTWGVLAMAVIAMSELSPPVPEAELLTLTGEPVSLAEMARRENRPLVANIWATWCPPCVREMPVFAEAQRNRPDILFAFANQGESAPLVQRFLDRADLALDNVLLDQNGQLSEAVGARVLPTTLFYDADGTLLHTHIGELSRATLERGLDLLSRHHDVAATVPATSDPNATSAAP